MEFIEFPKRIYISGKGFTVQNAEEEAALLGAKLTIFPIQTEELLNEVSPVQKQVNFRIPDSRLQIPPTEVPKKKPGRPKGSKGKRK